MEIFWKALVSGVVVALVLWLTKILGPRVGGLFAMIPALFTLSFVFATTGSREAPFLQDFLLGSFWGVLLFVPFLLVLYWLNKNPGNYWLNLGIAYGVWALLAGAWFFLFKK